MTTPDTTTSQILPFELELEPGERVLWSGTPRRGLVLQPADVLQLPISLGILYLLATKIGIASLDGPVEKMLAVVLVLAVLYFAIGRFFFDAYRRGKSAYALTTERMLIRDTAFSTFVKPFPLNTITDTVLREQRNGFGSIWIDRRFLPVGRVDTRLSASAGNPNGFAMIADARRVYDLLEAARLTRPAPTLESMIESRRRS